MWAGWGPGREAGGRGQRVPTIQLGTSYIGASLRVGLSLSSPAETHVDNCSRDERCTHDCPGYNAPNCTA